LLELGGLLPNLLPDQVLIGIVPIAHRLPGLAVPLRHPAEAAALVVLAAVRDRRDQPLGVEVLDHLDAPAQLVAGQRRAELLQRQASALDGDGHGGHADVVISVADFLGIAGALASLDHLLHDLLEYRRVGAGHGRLEALHALGDVGAQDRKSTRLNSSHVKISYAVFCLKKKNRLAWPNLDWVT